MSFRASLGPYFISLAASGLVLAGCPGDDGGATGSASSTGTGTTTSQDSTNGPGSATMDDTTGATGNGSSGTAGETEDDTTGDTTGSLECPYDEVEGMPAISLELVGQGFDRPVLAAGHPTEPDRLFVVEQGGNVRILEPGQIDAPADSFLFVDVEGANNNGVGAEFGLLGFAFHPDFPDDPRVYASYNPNVPNGVELSSVISEFTLDAGNPNQVDPASERIILQLAQPASNHNGGMITFGPDGFLYIGLGDGGFADDAFNTGRDESVLLAKILRIGVDPDGSDDNPTSCVGCQTYGPFDYTIPADNPFVGQAGFAPEIYSWGLRNPWRFSFDSATGDLYVADVGQNQWEEVALAPPGSDQGWSTMEGFHCFQGAQCDDTSPANSVNADGMTMPLAEYSHNNGRCSVTGATVYRGCEVPAWGGVYLYGDYCSGELFGLAWDGAAVTDLGVVLDLDSLGIGQGSQLPLGFGSNAYGDVFITTVDAILGGPVFDGMVLRVTPGA